jgi:hypothetical protein
MPADLTALHRAQVGVFRYLREDPEYRSISLKGEARGQGMRYQLGKVKHVYAIRWKYRYDMAAGPALLKCFWMGLGEGDSEHDMRGFAQPVARDGVERSTTVWVDDDIEQFVILPNVPTWGWHLRDVEALVAP